MSLDSNNHDILRIDATAEYTKELDEKMRQQYPVLSQGRNGGLDASIFRTGEVAHVSIEIPEDWEKNTQFRQNLVTLLEASKDPSHPAYSDHGSLHQTFDEAVDSLINYVQEGEFKIVAQSVKKNLKSGQGLADRFILQPNIASERTTYRPLPHKFAMDTLANPGLDEKGKSTMLKSNIKTKGIAFGILALAYNKPEASSIFGFFSNPGYKQALIDSGFKVPSPNRPEDRKMISEVCEILALKDPKALIASSSPDKYRNALAVLVEHGYISSTESESKEYGFEKSVDIALPKAVFIGANEKAQEIASNELKDPQRSVHIERNYGGYMTSILATAFIENI